MTIAKSRISHSTQACSSAGLVVPIGEKNELVNQLPGHSHRMASEIRQESLGILIIKKEYIKNEKVTVEKRMPTS